MITFEEYVRTRVDEELRRHSRWLVDCQVCGEPHRDHTGGECPIDVSPDLHGIEVVL